VLRVLTFLSPLVAALLVGQPSGARAATFLGPTPYLSTADSPFDLGQPGFCLEDFEDGVFNTIGASGNCTPTGPGGLTDSVDADDGAIDGSGTNGHSCFNASGASGITITFDPTAPGGLPTMAGMVWTDGEGTISFEAFDQNGGSLGMQGPFDHADGSVTGTTAEDRFYGETNAGGISAIKLTNTIGGIEIEHVQYNNCFAVAPTTTTVTTSTSTVVSTSTTSTSTTTVTSSTTIVAPTTTSSTTSSPTSSTTTLPGGCAGVPAGPSFASLDCRLADLIAAVAAAPQLGNLQAKLGRDAQTATQRTDAAESACAGGGTKTARKHLKIAIRNLIEFSHALRTTRAKHRVPEGVRTPLVQAADAIKADGQTLRGSLACPQ
jgi:hypothetical protein